MSLDNLDGQITPGDLLDLGIVTRDANGRLQQNGGSVPVFNAQTQYGAKGDGAKDDTAAVQAAITAAVAVGGVVYLPLGTYKLTAALSVSGSCSIVGAGSGQYRSDGGQPNTSPFLTGTVFLQTAAATDCIDITGTACTVHLRDFGIRFDSSIMFTNTGHGIVVQSSATFDTGHDLGITDSRWENVAVFGHDGNHYARVIVNSLNNVYVNMRSWGGGVVRYVQDSDRIVSGNTVEIDTFGQQFVAGTAHGFAFSPFSGSGQGGLNLFTFVRPQVNMVDKSAVASLGNPAKPTTSQYMWQAQDGSFEATSVGVIDPDLEADDSVAHPVNFGSAAAGNVVRGGGQVLTAGTVTNLTQEIHGTVQSGGIGIGPSALIALTTGQKNVALGRNALTALTTGSNNTGVGRDALAAQVTGINCTAVGQGALAAATANANTAVGSSALTAVTSGVNNVAVGDSALATGTTFSSNTAVGSLALQSDTGDRNVAVGKESLVSQTTATDNVAVGYQAGRTATSANATTTGARHTVIGSQAGLSSTSQVNDVVAVGYRALVGANYAIAIGSGVQATGSGAVAIGRDSGGTSTTTSVANQIALGTSSHHVLLKTAAAPADASLAASQFTLWLDATNGAAKLMVKAKQADGTVVAGSVTLA